MLKVFASLIVLFIVSLFLTASRPVPGRSCGCWSGVYVADDSIMFSYRTMKGADNYVLELSKKDKDSKKNWVRATADLRSGCARLGYFALYFRNAPNTCQTFQLEPGSYEYRIKAFRDSVGCNNCAADSCVMEGNFYLTKEKIWGI